MTGWIIINFLIHGLNIQEQIFQMIIIPSFFH